MRQLQLCFMTAGNVASLPSTLCPSSSESADSNNKLEDGRERDDAILRDCCVTLLQLETVDQRGRLPPRSSGLSHGPCEGSISCHRIYSIMNTPLAAQARCVASRDFCEASSYQNLLVHISALLLQSLCTVYSSDTAHGCPTECCQHQGARKCYIQCQHARAHGDVAEKLHVHGRYKKLLMG